MPPPKYRLNKIKSFSLIPTKLSMDNPMAAENLHKLDATIDDNTKIHGVLKHTPSMGPDAFKRTRPGVVSVLGIGMLRKRENPYKHPEFPEVWEPKDWKEARNTLSTGQLRELIHNVKETFPDAEVIRGYRTTGAQARKEFNPTKGLQEIWLRRKKDK